MFEVICAASSKPNSVHSKGFSIFIRNLVWGDPLTRLRRLTD
jgi:hypothetical protein